MILTYSLTHSLHGAGYYLKSWFSLSLSNNILLSYGYRRFITVFTQARHWTLSRPNWIQFVPLITVSLRSILMLSSHLGLPNQNPGNTSPLVYACHMSSPPHPPWFNHPNTIRWRIQDMKFIIMLFFSRSKYLPQHSVLRNPQSVFPPPH
jgi:hypothetical protein